MKNFGARRLVFLIFTDKNFVDDKGNATMNQTIRLSEYSSIQRKEKS